MNLNEIAYFTKNVQEMVSFYCALMGREPVAESPDMAIFLNGETKIFIHATYTPGAGELPPENHIAFTVVDVDQACRTLAAQGLVIEIEPHDYYWGRSAYLRDPDGHLIELIAQGES